MIRKLNVGTVAMGMACVLVLSSDAFCTNENSEGPVRLIRNIAAGPTNQVPTAMRAAGVRNCATRIDQVSNFLTKGTQSNALLFLPDKEPDSSMVSVSMEVQSEGTPRAYGSATFSPNTAVGCAGMYETVQYWAEPCNTVAIKHFKGAVSNGALGTEIDMLTIGTAARVFLMRATGSSCISIKKEVLN